MPRKSTKIQRVFVWSTGQLDNIGDSLLRRGYLNLLRSIAPLSIWTSKAGSDFFSGLGVKSNDKTFASYSKWYGAALRASIRGRTLIAINAGEVPVSRKGALRIGSLIPLLLVAKSRGGNGVWMGAGIPNPTGVLSIPYKVCARLCVTTRWRDPGTSKAMPSGSLAPDWGFVLGTRVADWPGTGERDTLTVVLRGDRRSVSETWLAWLKELAERHALSIVFVVQVARDGNRAVQLSQAVGGTVLAFAGSDHWVQEQKVRELYRRSLFTVGDRLHGLIVAATEGSIPIGWVSSSRGKIGRHFETVGMDWVAEFEGSEADLPFYTTIDVERLFESLGEKIESSRAALGEASSSLRKSVGLVR